MFPVLHSVPLPIINFPRHVCLTVQVQATMRMTPPELVFQLAHQATSAIQPPINVSKLAPLIQ